MSRGAFYARVDEHNQVAVPLTPTQTRRYLLRVQRGRVRRRDHDVQRMIPVPESVGAPREYPRPVPAGPTAPSVYFLQSGSPVGEIKIGSARDILRRVKELQTGNPYPLQVIGFVRNGGSGLEAALHSWFSASRLHGEWFRPDPELLEYISKVKS